jgi:hypothetical protein
MMHIYADTSEEMRISGEDVEGESYVFLMAEGMIS